MLLANYKPKSITCYNIFFVLFSFVNAHLDKWIKLSVNNVFILKISIDFKILFMLYILSKYYCEILANKYVLRMFFMLLFYFILLVNNKHNELLRYKILMQLPYLQLTRQSRLFHYFCCIHIQFNIFKTKKYILINIVFKKLVKRGLSYTKIYSKPNCIYIFCHGYSLIFLI